MMGTAVRYVTSRVALAAGQLGVRAAISVAIRQIGQEIGHLVRYAGLVLARKDPASRDDGTLEIASPEQLDGSRLGVPIESYRIDIDAFRAHVAACGYPRIYAAGSMDKGGAREQKLLEYFVSLDLLDVQPNDVIVDAGSEWSIFPDVVHELYGVQVYRQDLVYPPGIHGTRMGGSATRMPVPDGFADKLVLHNAFEHFEGHADTGLIVEAWRVLKPGGTLCILPLFMAGQHTILTDPLVDRKGIVWDSGARIVSRPWFHNRFARFYDVDTLRARVLDPGKDFETTLVHVLNPTEVHPRAYLHLALVMKKPVNKP